MFNLSPEMAFGLLAMGASPSGGSSNVFTMLLDGDVILSLCMTFCSTIITMGKLY